MRIAGITIPEKKRLEVALTAVYGIGRPKAKEILNKLDIDLGKRAEELTADEEKEIKKEIEVFKIEGDLRRDTQLNIKRLKDIKCYRGTRHLKHLPVRGQRTKTNNRTVRGNARRTMGSGRRKTEKT
ncbi:MAG: small subunit ribosomal protein [Patescibacteria group bacterium]|nr:small subunit ribosomal protein [Patescibacteria group bacterium]